MSTRGNRFNAKWLRLANTGTASATWASNSLPQSAILGPGLFPSQARAPSSASTVLAIRPLTKFDDPGSAGSPRQFYPGRVLTRRLKDGGKKLPACHSVLDGWYEQRLRSW